MTHSVRNDNLKPPNISFTSITQKKKKKKVTEGGCNSAGGLNFTLRSAARQSVAPNSCSLAWCTALTCSTCCNWGRGGRAGGWRGWGLTLLGRQGVLSPPSKGSCTPALRNSVFLFFRGELYVIWGSSCTGDIKTLIIQILREVWKIPPVYN